MVVIGASIQSILAEEFGPHLPGPRQHVLTALEELHHGYQLEAIELFLDGLFLFPDVVDDALIAQIGDFQRRTGVTLTAHLPYTWIDLSAANETIRRASLTVISQAIAACAPLDIASFVLHATGPFASEIASGVVHPEKDLWIRLALRGIDRSLGELRQQLPTAPIAVETLQGFPFDWQAPLVEQHGFDVCCDVGHLVVRGDDPFIFIERWLPHIRQFHLHGVREQTLGANLRRRIDHQALGGPGELVDSARLLNVLTERDFQGPIILETLSRLDLEQSLASLRGDGDRGA